uniref:Uncharacterized protein n=1 Tax=Anguilla anguilla TaxID=7936 RepID=A0A0E9TCD1_ANGAN
MVSLSSLRVCKGYNFLLKVKYGFREKLNNGGNVNVLLLFFNYATSLHMSF